MRFFKNCKEALFEVERDLVEFGINVWPKSMQNRQVGTDESYQTKELVGYGFRIHDADPQEAIHAVADFHKASLEQVQAYLRQEIDDRFKMPPVNPGTAYLVRKDIWEPFLVKGRFDYTYSERVSPLFHHVVQTLISDVASRQAVLSVWRPLDIMNSGGRERIPCSLNYQFLIRPEDKKLVLHVIYTMRSCDIYQHFGYDVALTIGFTEIVRRAFNATTRPGHGISSICLTMNVGSLHAYRRDYEPRGVF